MSWLPMVWTGENEVIGSWKIIAASPPRMARSSRLPLGERDDVDGGAAGVVEQDPAGGAGAARRDPEDRLRGHGLAAARFADEPEGAALADGEADVVGRGEVAFDEREHDLEVLHLEQRLADAVAEVGVHRQLR